MLEELSVVDNELLELPLLPASLRMLYCNGNKIKRFPTLPAKLYSFYWDKNIATCVPNIPIGIKNKDIAPVQCPSKK
jgi:hypothetical protein